LIDAALDVAAWRDGCSVILEPVPPIGPIAEAVSWQEISLQWGDGSTNETAFEVERSPDGTSGWTKIATVGANGGSGGTLNYVDSGRDPSTTYHYRVRAINCAGVSAYTPNASATTEMPPPPPPEVPDGLVAVVNGSGTVDVSWNTVSGADSYDVGRADKLGKGNNWSLIATLVNVTAISHMDAPVVVGNTYRYYVRARNANGESGWSAHGQAKVSSGGGGGKGGGNGCTNGNKKNCGGT
ncbi:MAG: fibronectin type III domain-containing protein, partial [Alphaproteobacteria bacterium]|nr:fibronectin type III domain-containing protein [Alphaproteobacteria bacterium]